MRVTRRRFLSAAGAASVGAGLGAGVGVAASDRGNAGDPEGSRRSFPFFGKHQSGIATASQEHLQFAAFNVVSKSREDLRELLVRWSSAAAALTKGEPLGTLQTGMRPPIDSGEQLGLGASGLTVTFGLGRSLFAAGRFGLESMRPAPLVELPPFAVDALDPRICGGDLGVQVCAEDPLVAFHGLHSLIRLAAPTAVPRWALAGFGRTANSTSQSTPRNLMGFKDGTANVMGQDTSALSRFVWADASSPGWMKDGTYMVVRRIKMLLAGWDETSLTGQELTFGRHKISGAPLGGHRERDPIDLKALAQEGRPVIPLNAHIRLASPAYNDGERLLRRGYSFEDGIDPSTGSIAGGLLFICYQRDPRVQFIAIQKRLAIVDALNQHIQHVGSAAFACPPGPSRGGYVGETLFA